MGRLPTSGYCLTCRQRRVKCDRGRPSCQRCLRSGHSCRGYEALHVRMFGVPRPPLQSHANHADTTSPTRRPPASDPQPPAFPDELSGATPGLGVCLDYFLSSYRWAHWWKALLHHGLTQTAGSSAGRAFTESLLLGYFAAAHQDPRLLTESRRSYGEGLRQLSVALTFQPTETFAGLTLPIMILSMHPYVMDRSFELEHHLGLETVVMHCGPGAFQGPGIIDMFRSCRAMLVCQGLAKRRRTFLERQHWITVPFVGTAKTAMDELYDVLVHVPGLFEDACSSPQSEDIISSRVPRGSVEAVEALRQDLYAWRRARDVENPKAPTPGAVAPTSPSRVTATAEAEGQAPKLAGSSAGPRFGDVNQVLEMLTFNTTLICLSKLAERLAGPHNAITSQDGALSGPAAVDTGLPAHTAREMAQQCAYVAREIKNSRTVNFLALAPVGVAYCALKSAGELGDRLAGCIARMFRSEGFLAELEVFELWR